MVDMAKGLADHEPQFRLLRYIYNAPERTIVSVFFPCLMDLYHNV